MAAWTGIGLSFSTATHLRLSLLILSVGLILFLAARSFSLAPLQVQRVSVLDRGGLVFDQLARPNRMADGEKTD